MPHVQSRCEISNGRPSFSFQAFDLSSDVVVWRFAQRLPQSDLQSHEAAHRHVEEDLPHVPQFVQVHVGQADECKRQEGLAVPPHGEIGKQVALQGEKDRRAQSEYNTVGATLAGDKFPPLSSFTRQWVCSVSEKSRLITLFAPVSLPICSASFTIRGCTKGADENVLEEVPG